MKFNYKIWVLPLFGLLVLAAMQIFQSRQSVEPELGGDSGAGVEMLMAAYESQQSKVWVEVSGVVHKTLADDNKGSRHQRFIYKLNNGHTVLVAHNIDLAPYVPLEQGDALNIRGRYEWNKKGGVLHWTHHDSKGHIRGGWIELDGKQYK